MLANRLRTSGRSVVLTKEPTTSIVGGLSKAALNGEWMTSPRAMQLLFCADRAHHLENTIEPAVSRGKIVICDRYLFSTLAYGYVSKVNYKWLRYINLNFRMPDLGILIDVPAKTSIYRLSGEEDNLQLFSDRERLTKVRQMYLHVAREFHLKVVDGDADAAIVSEKIGGIVDKFLAKN